MSTISDAELGGGGKDGRAARVAAAEAEARVDVTLVRRFNSGDESAFNEIVSRHRRRIFNVVGGCLRDRADVEELVDDTFIRAFGALTRFRGESSLATWLHHIAINLARNRYWFLFRRRHLASSLDEAFSAETRATLADFAATDSPDPAEKIERDEFTALVVTSLDHLPPRHRDILKLRALLDRSYQDIADELSLNLGTVKSRIARARRHLRLETNGLPHATLTRSRVSG